MWESINLRAEGVLSRGADNMSNAGRPRTPTAALRLRNSRWANRNPDEPQPDPTIPECPDWLDDRARGEWDRIVPRLLAMNLLFKLDVSALARYCRLWSRWRQAEDFLTEHGQVHIRHAEDGSVLPMTAFPQTRIASDLAAHLIRLEQQFGLTPSARSSIEIPEAPTTDDHKLRYFNAR